MIEVFILSLIQGITEFLPVSSSSHLILISKYLEFENRSLSIDVSLHIGSFMAVIIYFNNEIKNFPEKFRIANTGGSIDNLLRCSIHQKGSVAFVTRSGGLLNELANIISQRTDGIHSGLSIGGDRYPGISFLKTILTYEKDPEIKMIVLLK